MLVICFVCLVCAVANHQIVLRKAAGSYQCFIWLQRCQWYSQIELNKEKEEKCRLFYSHHCMPPKARLLKFGVFRKSVSCNGLILDWRQGLWVPWANSFRHNSHHRERLSTWSDLPTKVAGEITHIGILATSLGKEFALWFLLSTTEESLAEPSQVIPLMSTITLKWNRSLRHFPFTETYTSGSKV